MEGKVVQVVEGYFGTTIIRLSLLGTNDDIVYLEFSPSRLGLDYKILEGDRLIIYGTMNGTITYTSVWNSSITIPQAEAEYIILKK